MKKNAIKHSFLFLLHVIGILVFLIMSFVNHDPIMDKLFIGLLIILSLNFLKLMQSPN